MDQYQIVYVSRNSICGTVEQVETEIAAILEKSRMNNERAGITGALLFNGQSFAQVLEGPAANVEETYERIQCDPRHADVVLLSNGRCASRMFSDWSMAYADPSLSSANREPIDLEVICSDPETGGARIVDALQQLLQK